MAKTNEYMDQAADPIACFLSAVLSVHQGEFQKASACPHHPQPLKPIEPTPPGGRDGLCSPHSFLFYFILFYSFYSILGAHSGQIFVSDFRRSDFPCKFLCDGGHPTPLTWGGVTGNFPHPCAALTYLHTDTHTHAQTQHYTFHCTALNHITQQCTIQLRAKHNLHTRARTCARTHAHTCTHSKAIHTDIEREREASCTEQKNMCNVSGCIRTHTHTHAIVWQQLLSIFLNATQKK